MATVLRFDSKKGEKARNAKLRKKEEEARNAELQERFGGDVCVVSVDGGLRSIERVLGLVREHHADAVDARFTEYPDGFGNNFQAAIARQLKRLSIQMLHPLWCGGVFAGYKEWPFRS